MTKKPKKKHSKRPARSDKPVEITAPAPEDMPDAMLPVDISGKTRFEHTVEVLIVEWAFFYGNHSPSSFLEFKGYSPGQIANIFRCVPASEWHGKRETAQNRVTETLVKRHVDIIAAVQEEHIKSSKLILAKAVKLLADGDVEYMDPETGKKKKRWLRSIDLLNASSSIEKAQKIYRTAMGLPNDEAGMSQILSTLQKIQTASEIAAMKPQGGDTHIHNTQVNVTTVQGKTPHELTHDDILLMIEARREQKAKQLALENPEIKEVTPTGPQDFTALKR